jgi:Spy/CpxP family protein refolding chaperone
MSVRSPLLLALLLATTSAFAGGPPALTPQESRAFEQMQAFQAEIGHDKRAFVDQQLGLSPQAAARFWPVYDAHQVGLEALNRRRLDNLVAYAQAWNAGPLNDATARTLARDALDIEQDEAELLARTFNAASKALSPAQAVRYLQIEAKVRAVVRFEQAAHVPLAK